MRVVVPAEGASLDQPASSVFGRCPMFVLVDAESLALEAFDNPAIGASGGAGVQAAQFVLELGADAVVSCSVGPKAYDVLRSADLPVYSFSGGTVREAVEAVRAGELPSIGEANVESGKGACGKAHHNTDRTRGSEIDTSARASSADSSGTPADAKEAIRSLRETTESLHIRLFDVIDRANRLGTEE